MCLLGARAIGAHMVPLAQDTLVKWAVLARLAQRTIELRHRIAVVRDRRKRALLPAVAEGLLLGLRVQAAFVFGIVGGGHVGSGQDASLDRRKKRKNRS
jgi:hypothetical protein